MLRGVIPGSGWEWGRAGRLKLAGRPSMAASALISARSQKPAAATIQIAAVMVMVAAAAAAAGTAAAAAAAAGVGVGGVATCLLLLLLLLLLSRLQPAPPTTPVL